MAGWIDDIFGGDDSGDATEDPAYYDAGNSQNTWTQIVELSTTWDALSGSEREEVFNEFSVIDAEAYTAGWNVDDILDFLEYMGVDPFEFNWDQWAEAHGY